MVGARGDKTTARHRDVPVSLSLEIVLTGAERWIGVAPN